MVARSRCRNSIDCIVICPTGLNNVTWVSKLESLASVAVLGDKPPVRQSSSIIGSCGKKHPGGVIPPDDGVNHSARRVGRSDHLRARPDALVSLPIRQIESEGPEQKQGGSKRWGGFPD